MKLSEINYSEEQVEVYRDGEFDSLGLTVSNSGSKLLTFIESIEYLDKVSKDITCIMCPANIKEQIPIRYGVLVSKKPRIDFFKIHNELYENNEYVRKSFKSKVGMNTQIAKSAIVSDNNVIIGDNVIIEDYVVIYENTTIESNTIIRAGCKIGGVGFEFKRLADERTIGVNHYGGVIIEKNCEVQYNSTIDKAVYPWDNTKIGEFSRLDNQVHISHAAKIGKRCFIAGNSIIGGRTVLGNDCWVGLSATISNGLTIGNKCKVNIGSVVTKSINDSQSVSGNFAISHNKFINFIKSIR